MALTKSRDARDGGMPGTSHNPLKAGTPETSRTPLKAVMAAHPGRPAHPTSRDGETPKTSRDTPKRHDSGTPGTSHPLNSSLKKCPPSEFKS